ncbi:putative signal peptidase complex component [Aulographum hederae CBS 113979]|uniref:Signal peptidase complex subunit 2 n=1 Tax=Aulographum hederae CBS 113979 TaxID=1176131 RepID=A0A6G1GZK9_9PEZI|nr:putative signal peptidase complex component [Aulographum hederae CBS 113979]
MSSEGKIAVYSLADLKTTTDDILPTYLTSLHFTPTHTASTIRLALGYSAVLLAAALFYFDYTSGWATTAPYTLPAVLVYFALNGAYTAWIFIVERGAVFEGVGPQGERVVVRSRSRKNEGVYFLKIEITGAAGKGMKEIDVEAPFTRWFTRDGQIVPKPFQQWLASSVDVVGKADPTNVVEDIGRGSSIEEKGTASGVNIMGLPVERMGELLGGAVKTGGGGKKGKR